MGRAHTVRIDRSAGSESCVGTERSSLRSVDSELECPAIEPRKLVIVGVSTVKELGTILISLKRSGEISPIALRGIRRERAMENSRELGRSCCFHVQSRSGVRVNQPAYEGVQFVSEKQVHKHGIVKRRRRIATRRTSGSHSPLTVRTCSSNSVS